MNSASANDSTQIDRRFLSMAIVLGIASGLIEGIGHLVLQQFDVLDNSWREIIWIAAFVNGFLLLSGCIGLFAGLSMLPARWRSKSLIAFSLGLMALVPIMALMLKQWMKQYAILILALGLATAFMRWFDRNPKSRLRLFERCLPWGIVVAVLAFVGIQANSWNNERTGTANLPPASASAPDVLVVLIDALRADHVSAYGYSRSTSPNIDRMAKEGTLFENAYASSSYSLPSHASMLTGLSPHEHGVQWLASKELKRRNTPTIGSALQSLGYRTGAFSANTFWFSREHGFDQGFLHFEDYFHSVTDMVLRTAYGRIASLTVLAKLGYEDIAGRKHASDINPAVLRWVDDSDSKPFFVFINYFDVHDPYLPPQPYRGRFSGEKKEPGGLINWQFHTPDTLTPEQLQSEIDAYDGAVAYVDDQVDALIKALKQRRTSRDLLVIVTSDHGEEFMDHGNLLHGHSLYRETIQVPLIFWQPGRVPKGIRVSQPVSNADIPATIMNLVGGGGLPGVSLDRIWSSSEPVNDWMSPLSELEHRPWVGERYPAHHSAIESVVTPDLHCIEYKGLRFEAFDWKSDVPEKNNLAEATNVAPSMRDCRDRLGKASRGSTP